MYVPITRKTISSYDVVFDEVFPSTLLYTSSPYAEAMAMRTSVSFTPYTTFPKEQSSDVTTFTQSEEGNLLSENCDDAEIGDKSNDNSILRTMISK